MAKQMKKGGLGRIPYTFDGKVLTIYPYQSQPGYPWPPTLADLTEPIIIPVKLLKELLASEEAGDAET